MNDVTERCVELRAGLHRLKQAKDNEAKTQELERRRSELEDARYELSEEVVSAQVLLDHEQLAASALPDCAKALESCEKVEALLDPEPTAITKGRDYSYLLNRVGKVGESLRAANVQSWRAVVSQHQGVDEAFLRRVELFPGQADTVRKIRELKRAYEEATRYVPSSEDAYERFDACYTALQQELVNLDPEAFPDDVLRFFRAAQQASGAPLDVFTDGVRDWIEENGFLDGVRVRFTGE